MNIDTLAEFVDNMIVQSDYPGFEPRSLKIGLSQELERAPAKLFGQALKHESIYVRLTALRWFQERPGYIKPYIRLMIDQCDKEDDWERMESIKALERFTRPTEEMSLAVAKNLSDENLEVQKVACRALGKIGKRLKLKEGPVIEGLNQLAENGHSDVRRKAEKALRKIGVYES